MRAYLKGKNNEYKIEMISWIETTGRVSSVSMEVDGSFETVFNDRHVPANEIRIVDPPDNFFVANLDKSIVWRDS